MSSIDALASVEETVFSQLQFLALSRIPASLDKVKRYLQGCLCVYVYVSS